MDEGEEFVGVREGGVVDGNLHKNVGHEVDVGKGQAGWRGAEVNAPNGENVLAHLLPLQLGTLQDLLDRLQA